MVQVLRLQVEKKMLKLKVKRIARQKDYTIGRLFINGVYFCDTLEDVDRLLTADMPTSEIKRIKVNGKTAIPTGIYQVTLGIKSPKFSTYKQYAFCDGYLPRLLNVPCYEGVLIHIGNTHTDTDGCILVGQNKQKGKVINSTATFKKLYEILASANETITIEIE